MTKSIFERLAGKNLPGTIQKRMNKAGTPETIWTKDSRPILNKNGKNKE